MRGLTIFIHTTLTLFSCVASAQTDNTNDWSRDPVSKVVTMTVRNIASGGGHVMSCPIRFTDPDESVKTQNQYRISRYAKKNKNGKREPFNFEISFFCNPISLYQSTNDRKKQLYSNTDDYYPELQYNAALGKWEVYFYGGKNDPFKEVTKVIPLRSKMKDGIAITYDDISGGKTLRKRMLLFCFNKESVAFCGNSAVMWLSDKSNNQLPLALKVIESIELLNNETVK
jgi:hypothetical protein